MNAYRFLYACTTGEVDIISKWLDTGGDINAKTSYGNTCLHQAAKYGKNRCCRITDSKRY